VSGLKVLFVIDGLGTGGAERSLAEMVPLLAEEGIVASIARLYEREGVERHLVGAGFRVHPIRGAGWLPRIRSLRAAIDRERPDLIHTTIFTSDLLGRFAAVGTRVPVLTSLVNVLYTGAQARNPNVSASKLALARMVDGWTARHLTAHFHAISEAVKRSAMRTLGLSAHRVTVIERGRDPVRLGSPGPGRRRRVRKALGVPDDREVVINVGRQDYQKGQRYLLEAIEFLAPRRPGVVLVLAGRRGDASPELEAILRRPSLRDRVRVLGFREDVPDLLAAADLFAFPSLYEGLGGVLIEAMALGLPIVASDLEAVREVVHGNAILVPPGRPPELAEAMAGLLEDPHRAREIGLQGRRIFEERFTLERSTGRMIGLYRRLVPGAS
jgi:glycosyltransferase involved in cell wall biosynthesis